MSLDKPTNASWRLFRDNPFPRIQLLAGGTPEERVRAIDSVGECDVLVVAGGLPDIETGVQALSKLGKPVVYVPGLEECRERDFLEVVALGRQAASGTLVHVLDRSAVVIDGIRYLGAMLWLSSEISELPGSDWFSDTKKVLAAVRATQWWEGATNAEYAMAVCLANNWAPPAKETRAFGEGGTHPVVALVEHRRTLAWLNDELAKPFPGPTVIVTHFEPEPTTTNVTASGRPPTHVRLLLRDRRYAVDLWLHGRTHKTTDTVVEGVRVFGGFPSADAEMDMGEILSAKLAERAVAKGRRKREVPPRPPICSPTINLDDGLKAPLSLFVEPLLAEMWRVQKSIDAVVPHTMTRSTTLRMCVCRTIHSEVRLFERAGHLAYEMEQQLYPPANNVEWAIMAVRTRYEVPLGYPSKESKEVRFDYYGLVEKMSNHIEWLRELPGRAAWMLARWTRRTGQVLRELEARGIDACAVPPRLQSIRFPTLSEVIHVRVRCSEGEFKGLQEGLKQMFECDSDWPLRLSLTRVDQFAKSSERCLGLADVLESLDNSCTLPLPA